MAFENLSVLVPLAISAVGVATAVNRSGQGRHAARAPVRAPSILLLNGDPLLLSPGSGDSLVDGVETVFRSDDELAFTVGNGEVCLYETVDGRDLAGFGLIQVIAYPRRTATLISSIAEYLGHRRVRTVNVSAAGIPTRLYRYIRFTHGGLPVPMTACFPRGLLADSYPELAEALGLPLILTAIGASGAGRDHLVGGERDFARHVACADRVDGRLLAQEFVPRDMTLRLLVLGGQVRVATRQAGLDVGCAGTAAEGERPVLMDVAELDPALTQLAVRAATLIGSGVAEVDLIRHWTTGDWYVLDATASPAIGTGAFAATKLSAYAEYLRGELRSRR